MGKGGQKVVDAPVEATTTAVKDTPVAVKVALGPMKLDHMHTEELKKWAKAYGVNPEADRDTLLSSLVKCMTLLHRSDYQNCF